VSATQPGLIVTRCLARRGVGVGGLTLGGGELSCMIEQAANHLYCAPPKGYSWKSQQHGLTVDTVVSYELVRNLDALYLYLTLRNYFPFFLCLGDTIRRSDQRHCRFGPRTFLWTKGGYICIYSFDVTLAYDVCTLGRAQ
jgi:hypothetical protein